MAYTLDYLKFQSTTFNNLSFSTVAQLKRFTTYNPQPSKKLHIHPTFKLSEFQ